MRAKRSSQTWLAILLIWVAIFLVGWLIAPAVGADSLDPAINCDGPLGHTTYMVAPGAKGADTPESAADEFVAEVRLFKDATGGDSPAEQTLKTGFAPAAQFSLTEPGARHGDKWWFDSVQDGQVVARVVVAESASGFVLEQAWLCETAVLALDPAELEEAASRAEQERTK